MMEAPFLLAIFIFQITFSIQNGSEHDKDEAFLSMLVSEYSYGAFARNQPEEKLRETNEWLERFGKSLTTGEHSSDLKQIFDDFETKQIVFTSRSHMQEESRIGWGIFQVTMKETPYIFVAFKGTSDCQDLVCDFKWSKQINAELQTECHNGINEIFVKSHLEETVLEELRRIHNTMNDEQKLKVKIIITGHSLGGGAAQILGAYLKRNFLTNDYIRKLIEKADKNHPNYSYVGMLHPNRVTIWCRESIIYSIASPQVFTDIRVGNDSECDWVNQLESSSFHYVNQHDPVVEFNILNGRDQLQPENNEEAYKWIEYGEIYYWTNKNKKFGKINFEDLEKMSKTKTELVVKGIWNTKYHFMRTYLTHFAMQEIDGYEMIDNLNDDTFPKIVIASVCTVGFCCFLGAIFIICFACAGCSTKAKHKPQPRKNVDTEIILQP